MERTVFHVKRKDLVQVMTGREKGKTGKILRVLNKRGRVVVEKINMLKRHTKPTGKSAGGIVEKEGTLPASNVLLFCEKCNRGVRTRRQPVDGAGKVRACRKCGSQLDK